MQRYFVRKENDKFILSNSDLHHIKDVMRIKSNGQIICVYNNQSYLCSINYFDADYKIDVIKEVTIDVELNKSVILYQALIKNDKFDLVVQKSTELGVTDIVPTIFSRSVVKVDESKKDNKLARYEKIVKEACEQSHRLVLPNIHNYSNVKNIKLDSDTMGLIAYENSGDFSSFANNLNEIDRYSKIAVVIGPEGGFSNDEVEYLKKIGFKSISLGKRILRSETAAMYALSVISHYLESR